ncbi:MAG: nucleotidyl transferase AbiEii/AbiGii toxin family protein [Thermoleophilia bacterium]|nr:nucleotidyl transferase AbiEii/AbiGii toxin family protein [Thermoleophilia bacterium]
MADVEPYTTPAGVEAAIKDAAKKSATTDPSLNTNQRIRGEYFDRFLSRVFSEGDESEWLLKGGTGLLARVPSARATLDIDLYRDGFTLDEALADLRRLASTDLGDHFRFEYAGHEKSISGEQQPYTDGYAVTFKVFIGGRGKDTIRVDLAVGAGPTDSVTTANPANALDLPRLVRHQYRLFPVADQIAEKVCATMQTYHDRPSSREKDLVDLVLLAVTQDVDGAALGLAISTGVHRRLMEPFDHFVVPNDWGPRYSKLAKPVPYCADFRTIDLAREFVAQFIDPVLKGTATGHVWSSRDREWK